MADKSGIDLSAVIAAEEDLAGLKRLSLAERGQLIIFACRAAARIEQGKQRSGLPPSQPEPWPKSTWMHLQKWARDARSTS
jgi:hypothetical protein